MIFSFCVLVLAPSLICCSVVLRKLENQPDLPALHQRLRPDVHAVPEGEEQHQAADVLQGGWGPVQCDSLWIFVSFVDTTDI